MPRGRDVRSASRFSFHRHPPVRCRLMLRRHGGLIGSTQAPVRRSPLWPNLIVDVAAVAMKDGPDVPCPGFLTAPAFAALLVYWGWVRSVNMGMVFSNRHARHVTREFIAMTQVSRPRRRAVARSWQIRLVTGDLAHGVRRLTSRANTTSPISTDASSYEGERRCGTIRGRVGVFVLRRGLSAATQCASRFGRPSVGERTEGPHQVTIHVRVCLGCAPSRNRARRWHDADSSDPPATAALDALRPSRSGTMEIRLPSASTRGRARAEEKPRACLPPCSNPSARARLFDHPCTSKHWRLRREFPLRRTAACGRGHVRNRSRVDAHRGVYCSAVALGRGVPCKL